MPYLQESDTFHDDPRWAAAAEGRSVTVDQLQAGYMRLKSLSARHATSGWLTEAMAREQARPAVLTALATRAITNMPPMLHTPKDECDCFEAWVKGYAYLLHRFFVRNPSKAETSRARAQKREREDPRIRAQVYQRDGGCCRYCRSGPMRRKGMGRAKDRRVVIHYDHVDPEGLAGDDLANLVVSCGRCNDEKGARTPFEADMLLLSIPGDQEREQWLARAECARFDRPGQRRDNDNDNASNNDGPLSGGLSPPLSASLSSDADADADSAGEVRPQPADEGQRQTPALSSEGAGAGRGGPAVVVPEGQPARSPDAPDIYHGRSRGGAQSAGGDEQ